MKIKVKLKEVEIEITDSDLDITYESHEKILNTLVENLTSQVIYMYNMTTDDMLDDLELDLDLLHTKIDKQTDIEDIINEEENA